MSTLSWFEFGPAHCREFQEAAAPSSWPVASADNVVWINIHGLEDPQLLSALAHHYGIHPLVLEDILAHAERPKIEEYADSLFVIARLIDPPENGGALQTCQFALLLQNHVVLTFQEQSSGLFGAIRERLRHQRSQIARLGADHLAYLLLDAVFDRYYRPLEVLIEKADQLETRVMIQTEPQLLRQIHQLKRQVAQFRRHVWPVRDMAYQLAHLESALIDPDTRLYLRDIQDHTLHVLEALELLREQASGLLDVYLSMQSHRLNQQMRVLTVITTLFMPLTLVAGIYGMNFDFMPELHWHYGYFAALGLMLGLAVLMLWLFRRLRWI